MPTCSVYTPDSQDTLADVYVKHYYVHSIPIEVYIPYAILECTMEGHVTIPTTVVSVISLFSTDTLVVAGMSSRSSELRKKIIPQTDTLVVDTQLLVLLRTKDYVIILAARKTSDLWHVIVVQVIVGVTTGVEVCFYVVRLSK